MSKEIKNKILIVASKKGSTEQFVSHDWLPYVEEMRKDGVITYVHTDTDDRGTQVTLTNKGQELLKNGGYK